MDLTLNYVETKDHVIEEMLLCSGDYDLPIHDDDIIIANGHSSVTIGNVNQLSHFVKVIKNKKTGITLYSITMYSSNIGVPFLHWSDNSDDSFTNNLAIILDLIIRTYRAYGPENTVTITTYDTVISNLERVFSKLMLDHNDVIILNSISI